MVASRLLPMSNREISWICCGAGGNVRFKSQPRRKNSSRLTRFGKPSRTKSQSRGIVPRGCVPRREYSTLSRIADCAPLPSQGEFLSEHAHEALACLWSTGDGASDQTTLIIRQHLVCEGFLGQRRCRRRPTSSTQQEIGLFSDVMALIKAAEKCVM